MTTPIDIDVITSTDCSFDGTARVPRGGALFMAEAKGTNSENGNWTAIAVTLTNMGTGAFYRHTAWSGTERVILPIPVQDGGLYRIQVAQDNFRETCQYTRVAGRTLDQGFFE
jgi:hypothetical protein